jgi:hypothetical protein
MAGLFELAGTDDWVRTVRPATIARQVRITRHFALGIFSLIIIPNLSWAKSAHLSAGG